MGVGGHVGQWSRRRSCIALTPFSSVSLMMCRLDSDPAPVAVHAANKWDGEDQAEEDVLDSWDAEPEEPKAKSNDPAPEKKKAITKRALAKKEEEERKLAEKMVKAHTCTHTHNTNHIHIMCCCIDV